MTTPRDTHSNPMGCVDEIRTYLAEVKEQQEWFRSRRLGDSYNTAYDDDCDGCEMINAANTLLAAIDTLTAERDTLKAALRDAVDMLDKLHPMNPAEPCCIYEAWEAGKKALGEGKA